MEKRWLSGRFTNYFLWKWGWLCKDGCNSWSVNVVFLLNSLNQRWKSPLQPNIDCFSPHHQELRREATFWRYNPNTSGPGRTFVNLTQWSHTPDPESSQSGWAEGTSRALTNLKNMNSIYKTSVHTCARKHTRSPSGSFSYSLLMSQAEGLDVVRRRERAHSNLLIAVCCDDVLIIWRHALRSSRRENAN